jgi:hypothetical protein
MREKVGREGRKQTEGDWREIYQKISIGGKTEN